MKRKKKKLKTFPKIIIILIIFGIIYLTLKTSKSKDIQPSKIETLMKEENINKDKYSKTLEYVLLNNIYDEKYLNEYKDIQFNNENNFNEILTTFLPKGYTGKEINYLLKLSKKNIEYLKETEHQDISKYYEYKNFDATKINRYNTYQSNNNYSIEDVITHVNINIDLPPYEETYETSDPSSLTVLVNKYNHLPKSYKPNDLIYLDGAYGNKVPVRKVLEESFLKLQEAAKKEINITLKPTTAFRDENFQTSLYNKYVAKDGINAADTYSARPGYSEHQTGLSIDLKNTDLNGNTRLTDDDYKWLEDNAYKYGFIIRFPKGKEHITGYQFENWHIRYVGNDIAKIIHDNKLTLEEYIDKYIKEY